ncbi:acetoacetate decarboxylase family protein [Nitrosomonas sp. Nm58]|uniref:acetoacetate decarboxylase family protein n=1 Tax=Nitrosomonas sp. Nm58 TaxID=200126 RepID=UPI000897651A|nr:acetoacetate decarboxylase family protein [Nitrosomonas sp. Nm58]SDY70869.1 Acetoacetate decarboxylase (ADC) [Nitrosomonas sp. Nm58]
MGIPKRIKVTSGQHSLVDDIPFQLPVQCAPSPVLMAAFPINADKAEAALPAEVHPLRLRNNKGLLVVTVINYLGTNIGKYIEYSIGIACTHGLKPAPPLLPLLLMNTFGTGQYVLELPVSTKISVKGGKGIWGMPKHQGNLDFKIGDNTVSSQYDLDGQLVTYIEIARPSFSFLPLLNIPAVNYCAFRGMLMKSSIYIKGWAGMKLFKFAKAKLVLGDHPHADVLKTLEIENQPLMTAFIPGVVGTLDDHIESWFLHQAEPPSTPPEGFESVIDLPQDETWPPSPSAPIIGETFGNLNR